MIELVRDAEKVIAIRIVGILDVGAVAGMRYFRHGPAPRVIYKISGMIVEVGARTHETPGVVAETGGDSLEIGIGLQEIGCGGRAIIQLRLWPSPRVSVRMPLLMVKVSTGLAAPVSFID